MPQIDAQIVLWLNSFAGKSLFLDAAIIFGAVFLVYFLILAVAVLLIFCVLDKWVCNVRQNFKLLFFSLASGLFARFILTELIRFFWDRPRPFEVYSDIYQLVLRDGGGSFPSGHAAFSFAVATAISFFYPKTSIIFFTAAIFVGISRIAAGVHFPSDILGGSIIGVLSAFLIHVILKNIKHEKR